MSVIARWECPTCGEPYFAGSGYECNGSRAEPHAVVDLVKVEYVPASDLRGAVGAVATLREALREVCGHSGDDPIRIENIAGEALDATAEWGQ